MIGKVIMAWSIWEFWLIQHCPLVVKSRAVGNDELQESVDGYVDY